MSVESDDDVLLVDEVAALTRLPESTLRSYRHRGVGPVSFKVGGRRVGYLRRDVRAWLDKQRADTKRGAA